MYVPRLRTIMLALAASAGLAGCAYDDGYGYGGVSVGYGSGWYDPWYYDDYYPRYYGWYDGFYYPGTGYYVFDRKGYRHRWSDGHRRYWEGRRHAWRDRDNDRQPRADWRGYRRDRTADNVDGPDRGADRPAWRGDNRGDFRRNRTPGQDATNPGRMTERPAWRQRGEAARPQPRIERGEGRGMSARERSGERSSVGRDRGPRQRD